MAYRFDARSRRAPLAVALAAVMLGAAGADAYAGADGGGRKIGAKAKEVTGRLCQSPLERIRAKYRLKQEQPGIGPSVGANANPGHKVKADANGAKPRKVNVDVINRLAQPKVVKLEKTESKPEVQARRAGSKAKPGGDLQRRGEVVQRALPREPLPRYGYKPVPSFEPVEHAIAARIRYELRRGDEQAVQRQAPLPFPGIYRGVELKDLSAAETVLAISQSNDFKALFKSDPAGMWEDLDTLKAELSRQDPQQNFGALWASVSRQEFDLACRDPSQPIFQFDHLFKQEVEVKLFGTQVFGYRLPEAMSFQRLPFPENIVAVVARVSDATAQSARYVVAYVDANAKLVVPGGFNSLACSEATLDYDKHGFDVAELDMPQVEYVVYSPHQIRANVSH